MKNKYLRPELRTILDIKGQILAGSPGQYIGPDKATGDNDIISADSKYSFNY